MLADRNDVSLPKRYIIMGKLDGENTKAMLAGKFEPVDLKGPS